MSAPATPTTYKKTYFPPQHDGTETSSGWLGALGGVVGEFFQGWSLLSALKKRTGFSGFQSTPGTPPVYRGATPSDHEHIELSPLTVQHRKGHVDDDELKEVSPLMEARRRLGLHSRPSRHSYYEGSSPHSYLLTSILIHSLKHGSGNTCDQLYCPVCSNAQSESKADTQKCIGKLDYSDGLPVGNSLVSLNDYSSNTSLDSCSCSSTLLHCHSSTNTCSCTEHRHLLSGSYECENCSHDTFSHSFSCNSVTQDASSVYPISDSSLFSDYANDTLTITEPLLAECYKNSNEFMNENHMSSSIHSLPTRLTMHDRVTSAFVRPILVSSGSLILLSRRPSLTHSPPVISYASEGHFKWEENPCYLRVENGHVGEGHNFRASTLDRPVWCDACAHLVFYHAIICSNCSLVCHEQCRDLITIDCRSVETVSEDESTEVGDVSVEEEEGKINVGIENIDTEKHERELQEKDFEKKKEKDSTLKTSLLILDTQSIDSQVLEEWIQKHSSCVHGLRVAKESDGSYHGYIRVKLNLSRPINIVAGSRPPSIYDILQEDRTLEKTLTTFYMPRDSVKAVHVSSTTTTREVIIALLRKFKVVDNPQKFALYEWECDPHVTPKACLRRLTDSECPLILALKWNAEGEVNKRLVLQENDTGDIQWEAFSLPELSNFLRILDREEEEYCCQIRDKYLLLKRRIQDRLAVYGESM